jgi:hypothetical protein
MPLIFEPTGEATRGNLQIWFGLSGTYSIANGGAEVWRSSDGGTTYEPVGVLYGNAATGVLTAMLPSTADPDTTDTLSVDLTQSFGTLKSLDTTLADLFYNLCYVDGELIAYATATPSAPNQYGLTYLRRGLYGSTIGAHAVGSIFVYLGQVLAPAPGVLVHTYRRELIGKTLHFKFTPFNLFGANQIALSDPSITAYAYTTTGAGELGVANVPPAFVSGPFTANQVLFQYVATGPFIIPLNATGSIATLGVATTANLSLSMKKNGVTFGTILFLAGGTSGSFSCPLTSFITGDVFTVVAPASPDATAANLSLSIATQ